MGIREDCEKLLNMQSQLQQQAQYPQQQSSFGLLGSAIDGWGISNRDSQASASSYPSPETLQQFNESFKNQTRRILSFFRINKRVEIWELDALEDRFIEPLDELRIKVAKWLYKN